MSHVESYPDRRKRNILHTCFSLKRYPGYVKTVFKQRGKCPVQCPAAWEAYPEPLRETKYPAHIASLSKHIRATLTRYIFSAGNAPSGCPAAQESYPDPLRETKYPAHMGCLSKHIRIALTRIFNAENIP
jgi:hypothetical protein